MPDWHEDAAEAADAARWPLRLLTAPGYFQPHTAFAGNGYLRRREGPPACVLHPVEATQRGLRAGEAVELVNDRGRFVAQLQVSDEIMPGVVFVSGQRSAGEAVKGTVNVLCADRLSDFGGGATYQSTYLEVRRAN
jgi:anaerobic selenocysteine-containing dehydrogenase